MGTAEVISCEEVRASKQRDALRRQLHTCFDPWLDGLEAQLHEPAPSCAQVTEMVWNLRHALPGSLTETIVAHTHQGAYTRQQSHCPQCDRLVRARAPVSRTVETMGGPVPLERPYCSCRTCHCGVYPRDEVLGLTAGRTQLDVHKAVAKLVTEVLYDEAHTLCGDLTGLGLGSERRPTLTKQVAEGLTVWDVAPWRDEIARRIAEGAAGSRRRPVLGLGIDGAYGPTRPDSARGRRPGQGRHRSTRPRWQGAWHDAKGLRFSLMDGERLVHRLSGHQGQNECALREALQQIKKAGLIPADQVRLCVGADGAPWRWKHVKALCAGARQVLDSSHCADSIPNVAKAPYGQAGHALAWAEATMTRLYVGKVGLVRGGLRRMQAQSAEAAKALTHGWEYLTEHRARTDDRKCRRGGSPLGSGGIASSNKCIGHVRLKRSGAWWDEVNSNQMCALRCAKYNGTLDQVFERYQHKQQGV